jgi:DNA-binding HxlR family transcriptional regulator/transcriptional regulator with XRE-family HTH domain
MKKVTKHNKTEQSRMKQAKLKPPFAKKSLEHGMSKASLFANKFNSVLGKVLRAKRIELELSRKEFASQAGCSQNFVRQFETGNCGLSVAHVVKIANALDMSVSEVFLTTERALKSGSKMRELEHSIKIEIKKNKNKAHTTPELLQLKRQRSQELGKATNAAARERAALCESRMFEKQEAREFAQQKNFHDTTEKKPRLKPTAQNKSDEFSKTTVAIAPTDAAAIESVIQLLGSRWTASILIEIARGTKRTTRIMSKVSSISSKMASLRLTQLQQAGLITRKDFREQPPRVEYTLTPEGHRAISLMETIKMIVKKLMV